jgi:DNA-binding NarL/FixJ family response regulator
MAREMDVTTETLRTYVKNVLGKLGAHSRLEAAVLAKRLVPAGRTAPRDHPLLATLTPREREVLTHLASGSRLRDVASHLHMSLKTVNTHLHNLRGKLGVHSTLEAVALAQPGLAPPAGSAIRAGQVPGEVLQHRRPRLALNHRGDGPGGGERPAPVYREERGL